MSTEAAPQARSQPAADPRRLAHGLAALRFEQPHEWLPPLILALVPAGLVWGLDGRLNRNRPKVRWPS